MVVDAVDAQQIDVVYLQPGQRVAEVGQELPRIGRGLDLGLQDELIPRQILQQPAKLPLGRAVAPGRFEMMDAQLQGAANGGLQVRLILARDAGKRRVLPLILIAHAAAGQDRHGKFRSAKSSVEHG